MFFAPLVFFAKEHIKPTNFPLNYALFLSPKVKKKEKKERKKERKDRKNVRNTKAITR